MQILAFKTNRRVVRCCTNCMSALGRAVQSKDNVWEKVYYAGNTTLVETQQ